MLFWGAFQIAITAIVVYLYATEIAPDNKQIGLTILIGWAVASDREAPSLLSWS